MKIKLTKDEKKVAEDLKRGKYQSLSKSDVKQYAKLATSEVERRKESRKEERINIRLTPDDLAGLRVRAEEEGLPYQTLVASVIHKYVDGQLVDVNNLSAIKRALKVD
ncbi:MAG: hypothetical protein EA369_09710 [Bradymonadales bacterium]|nr:MAG: hypothetical protein EA369_09710 [Bradymonadales bacterium]